jgi:predicted kinase
MVLVVITGLPGVGKSTVAKILAEHVGMLRLNSDVIRQELFPEKRTYDWKETARVIQETKLQVRNALRDGKDVVLDALFTKERARNEYRRIAEEEGADFRLLYLAAGESDVKDRLEKRKYDNIHLSEADFSYL